MSAQVEEKRDYFWIYVGVATIALVGAVVMAKLSENDKYDPIRQQQAAESAQMNIRIIKDY
ncbi:hypothetical protein [Methyloterricola oryzae]|uniref:hypothetical protein n=1 Tax=Methyloterricola oryzae TaxID=1495050 RepID=UPI0005EBD6D3|nr:hypothetical protein [Methyloterricola oryzae]